MASITTMAQDIPVRPGASAALYASWPPLQRGVVQKVRAVLSGRPWHFAQGHASAQWQKSLPDEFTRLPGFFPPSLWQTLARLYYTVPDPNLSERIHVPIQGRPAQLLQWSHTFLFLPKAKILCPSERLPEPFADASTDSVVISTAGVCSTPVPGNRRTVG